MPMKTDYRYLVLLCQQT